MDGYPGIDVDLVIFGGGCAGLWLVDELRRRGLRVVLLEAARLGSGQTAGAQGILHGGFKYSLGGILAPSARMVRDMPAVWQASMIGQAEPNLVAMRLRSQCCYLWRSQSLLSWAGILGAAAGLNVKPVPVAVDECPQPLAHCPGPIYRLDETVIDPVSFIQVMLERNRGLVWKIDPGAGLEFERLEPGEIGGQVKSVLIQNPDTGERLRLSAASFVLAAGEGNEGLREQLGLPTPMTQLRPLRVALLRGALPQLNGHCVEGVKPKITITADIDAAGRAVWQLGGQIAEDGVRMEPLRFIEHARRELAHVLPGWQCPAVEWATYCVNRAERMVPDVVLPDDVQIIREMNILTVWPTKLVLAPRLAQRVASLLNLPALDSSPSETTQWQATAANFNWPAPKVALPPWEREQTWMTDV
ncbi:MAG: FAD-dependent oxidoreductase [Planctomycetia bacterium]|nr:FAD-dependent oxidoreductase [Planctomycetia bacterium]